MLRWEINHSERKKTLFADDYLYQGFILLYDNFVILEHRTQNNEPSNFTIKLITKKKEVHLMIFMLITPAPASRPKLRPVIPSVLIIHSPTDGRSTLILMLVSQFQLFSNPPTPIYLLTLPVSTEWLPQKMAIVPTDTTSMLPLLLESQF